MYIQFRTKDMSCGIGLASTLTEIQTVKDKFDTCCQGLGEISPRLSHLAQQLLRTKLIYIQLQTKSILYIIYLTFTVTEI